MPKIRMPNATLGKIVDRTQIAAGPFVAVHNGVPALACCMSYAGDDDIVLYAGGNDYTIDPSYTIDSTEDAVTAVSGEYESSWVFRALRIEDAEWLLPDGETVNSLDELNEWAADQLSDR